MRIAIDGLIWKKYTPEAIFARLARVVPQFVRNEQCIEVQGHEDDPAVQALISEMLAAGLDPFAPRPPRGEPPRNEPFRRTRTYSAADLASCELLQIWPSVGVDDVELRAPYDGILSAYPQVFPKSASIARTHRWGSPMLVPDVTRIAIEHAGLRGPEFRPIRLVKQSPLVPGVAPGTQEVPWGGRKPWWQMWSTVELPAVAPGLVLLGDGGVAIARGETDRQTVFYDVGFDDAELRYHRRELRPLGEFDFAMTLERSLTPADRYYICSQRFYQFCLAQGCDCIWRPVRIID